MTLPAGNRLGPYEIVALIGAGGMGEVYCARDAKLDRQVAIKLVLDSFVADPDRAARFDREARALAALNHPNIATLYGFEHASGRHFLVMELVEGETLAERIARHPGGLPLEEALQFAKQIAEALEAAHEKGIVHRDLKPANVKITPDDKVKVLDFGLAKVAERDAPSASNIAQSPTMSALGTQAGLILGTASYMSPEQARGYAADHRSDIFSFGILLYEMLTGRQPFPGETISDVLASVLARDPDLGALPADLSPRLIDLLRRCLEKNARRRWQAIGDVRYELEALMANPRATAQPQHAAAVAPPLPLWRRALPVVAAVLLTALIVAAAALAARPTPDPPVVTRFTITPPEGRALADTALQGLAVSPDGTRVAYSTQGQIYVRTLSQFTPLALLSADAQSPLYNLTFSPDGQSLVYWSGGSILRVPVTGGPSVTIAAAGPVTPFGITWSGESLVFAHQQKIQRVSASGGDPETLLELPADERPWRPQLLPDGRTLLFTVYPAGGGDAFERTALVAQRIGETARTKILEPAADARFIAPDYLVFAREGVLLATAFDPSTLNVIGAPVPLVEGVRRTAANAQFAIGSSGVLAYVEGSADTSTIRRSFVVADRSGARQFLKVPPATYTAPRLAPDGHTMAFVTNEPGERSIWIYDLRGTSAPRRLTFGVADLSPVWSADGTRVTFLSERGGDMAIYWQRADGSGSAEQLTTPEPGVRHAPMAWSPDGEVLLFDAVKDGEHRLMMWRPRDKSVTPFADVRSTTPTGAVFSSDGRWIAYSTRAQAAGARSVVFVQPFPATGALFQISRSAEDARHPIWANQGKELVYSPGGQRLVAVPLTLSPAFSPGEPVMLQRPFLEFGAASTRPYDPAPGLKFLGLSLDDLPVPAGTPASPAAASRPREIKIILNWFEELRAKVKR
ncbi:MAG: protein kinase [Vicinamibacterales bacterium]